mmetsp:Transcript_67022/g.165312  ORF Transcript_67022/g.165312 Transcript_67022/m.165312 type:complete len:89 (+) Transcript_67022:2114-2380(+)
MYKIFINLSKTFHFKFFLLVELMIILIIQNPATTVFPVPVGEQSNKFMSRPSAMGKILVWIWFILLKKEKEWVIHKGRKCKSSFDDLI